MKKLVICLVLCFLGLISVGQGTTYITKSNLVASPHFIRQYNNQIGWHAIYFTEMTKNYFGLTDIFNVLNYVQVSEKYTITDFEILGDTLYMCGHTYTNKGLIGILYLPSLYSSPSLTFNAYFDTTVLDFNGIMSLSNIEVYKNAIGITHIAGYGYDRSGKQIGFEGVWDMSSVFLMRISLALLPYKVHDLTVTDNYVVYVGTNTNTEIIIHPFPKFGGMFSTYYAPYYQYNVGSATIVEPYNKLHIVNVGNDVVTTLSYRLEGGASCMVLRDFDVTAAFPSYNIPMTASLKILFDYTANQIIDFRYNALKKLYTVFHNYEVNPSDPHDVVTHIDFMSGTPSTALSEYLAINDHVMRSMSLSDSIKYVVYGYDILSNAMVYWKGHLNGPGTGLCLNTDILPIVSIPSVYANITDTYYSESLIPLNFLAGSPFGSVRITNKTICH